MKTKYIHYYVEGEDEKKVIDVLKTDLRAIKPGKVTLLNPVAQEIKDMHLRPLTAGTMVVLVFDTDAGSVDILKKNMKKLAACRSVSEVVLIPQVPNLEGELVRSCDIKDIREFLNSQSRTEFKHDIIHVSNLANKLSQHRFSISLFWTSVPPHPYHEMRNQADKVKLL